MLEKLSAVASNVPAAGPREGQPSVDWDGNAGSLTTGPLDKQPDSWDALISDWGLDPAEVQVVAGSVQIRAWDANVGKGEIKRLRYYKAQLERRCPTVDTEDIEELKRALMRRKPLAPANTGTTTGGTRIVLLSDWQLGKGDGDGVEGTVKRIALGLDMAARQAKNCDRIVLAGLGDLVEQCTGHYSGQAFTVQLDRREQIRFARRLILRAVDTFSRIAPVDVVCVPGNHGENREGGKAFTRTSDNDDCAVFEQVADIVAETDRYPDVQFGFPCDDYPDTVTIHANGVGVAFNHGTEAAKASGGSTEKKLENWIKGQLADIDNPLNGCQVFCFGHKHYSIVNEGMGNRLILQSPASDGGSEWYKKRTGACGPPGMMAFTVGDFAHRVWGDLALT